MPGSVPIGRGMIEADVRLAPSWSEPAAALPRTPAWVERLAVWLLALTLLYATVGPGGADPTDPGQTDEVSPLKRWVWLGLLSLSLPVLQRRWRDVAALVVASWPLVLLFAYFALSVTWALDPSIALRRLLFSLVQLVLFAILFAGIRRAPAAHVMIAGVCAVAALANLGAWIIAPATAMTDEGFAGLLSQKNQTGLLMMYGCMACVPCLFLLRERLWRGALLAGAVLMGALLMATRSTTSQAVTAGAALVMPMLLVVSGWPRRLLLALAAAAVLIPAAALLGYVAWCGISGADPMLPLRGATFSARTEIWQFVIDQIRERPLLGAGYSSFWSIDPVVQPSLKSDQWFGVYTIINEAHNGYLDLLATGGVFGLAGGLAVLLRGIVLAWKALARADTPEQAWRSGRMARPTAAFHLAFLLGLLVHNATESNLFSTNALLAVGLLMCLLDLERWRLEVRRQGHGSDNAG